jgi:hypothetical protein
MKAMKRLKITQKNAEVEMDEASMTTVPMNRKIRSGGSAKKGHHPKGAYTRAARDARRAMGKDKDLTPGRDSADVDWTASYDDIKGASKNIIMQLRKASNRASQGVEFQDGKKHQVPPQVAQAVQSKFLMLKRPAEKQAFQSKISKSYADLLKAIKEDYVPIRKTILDRIDEKLMERKND